MEFKNKKDLFDLRDQVAVGIRLSKELRSNLDRLEKAYITEKVHLALDKHDLGDLMEIVQDHYQQENDIDTFVQVLMSTVKYAPTHGGEAYVVVKCATMEQVNALEGFVNSRIHPSYNEQQANIF